VSNEAGGAYAREVETAREIALAAPAIVRGFVGQPFRVDAKPGDEPVTEAEHPGSDFLGRLCVEWEAEARRAEALDVRVVVLRTGIVLGRGGGALGADRARMRDEGVGDFRLLGAPAAAHRRLAALGDQRLVAR